MANHGLPLLRPGHRKAMDKLFTSSRDAIPKLPILVAGPLVD